MVNLCPLNYFIVTTLDIVVRGIGSKSKVRKAMLRLLRARVKIETRFGESKKKVTSETKT